MYQVFEELEKFNNIVYYDEPHKYFLDGKPAVSVTTLIGKYEKPFDSDYWAKKKADEEGITVKEMLARWKRKADIACSKGTASHSYVENRLANKVFPYPSADMIPLLESGVDPVKDKYDSIVRLVDKYHADIRGKMIPVKSELIVGDPDYMICGMIDQLFYNRKTDQLQLWDWKTNEKIDTTSKYGLLDPISHISNSKLDIYSLQLSLYKYIIMKNTGLVIGDCYLTWFNENNPDYVIFKCHDYRNEVVSMLNHFRNKSLL